MLLGQNALRIRICADVNPCSGGGSFDLPINWSCNADGTCEICPPVYFNLQWDEAQPVLAVNPATEYPPSFILCASPPQKIKVCFTNLGKGDFIANQLTITYNPIITYGAVTMSTDCGANYTPLSPPYSFPNQTMMQTSCLCFEIEFSVGCTSINPIPLPIVELSGTNYCGTPLSIATDFPDILLGTTQCDDCFTITKTVTPTCVQQNIENATYTVTVCNMSSGSNTSQLTVTDQFPNGFAWTGGQTFPIIINANALTAGQCNTYTFTGYFTSAGTVTNYATVTNQTTGTSMTASVGILVKSDCLPVATNANELGIGQAGQPTLLSTVFAALNSNTITQVYVFGDIVQDVNFTKSNTIFTFNPGVEWRINAGQLLTISNCTMEACTKMWRGINMLNSMGNGSYLRAFNCTIKDAQYAITPSTNCWAYLFGNNFLNNYISIYSPPNNLQIQSVTPWSLHFYQNTITSVATFVMGYQGQTPAPQFKSLQACL
ncbi:MAG: hypothetical protein IPP29_21155 [Bacteroidetes bacterium]|nr:hypothetical protein [Bacteroidota bacterium]